MGTRVLVILPRGKAPDWFVPHIEIQGNSTVVILDDDSTIHQVWHSRLQQAEAREKNVTIHHFSSSQELIAWHTDKAPTKRTRYLVDYELIGSEHNGLELVRQLEIEKDSILVTSRFEEKYVVQQCVSVGMGLVPKGMAGFVPLEISDPSGPAERH